MLLLYTAAVTQGEKASILTAKQCWKSCSGASGQANKQTMGGQGGAATTTLTKVAAAGRQRARAAITAGAAPPRGARG